MEEMEGQQPTSPEGKKVTAQTSAQTSAHPSNPNEVFHTKCDFINTNRGNDAAEVPLFVQ